MKLLLLPLLAALALPTAINAKKNYKTLFDEKYDGYDYIVVEKIYDEWRDTTSCKIRARRAKIDPSNYQLHITGDLLPNYSQAGYKFDNGRINKFKDVVEDGAYKGRYKYKISIPYSEWSKHKILLINEGSITTNQGSVGNPSWNTSTLFTRIDIKVINRARKHHEACLKGGPSWLY